MATTRFLLIFALSIAVVLFTANAGDPDMLQDFCVATKDLNDVLFINGLLCKDPKKVTADDFLFKGLNISTKPNNLFGSILKNVKATTLPGLNTMGISMARIDFAPNGIGPPHVHPHTTEVVILLEGTVYLGFVDGNNKLFSTILNQGDVFVFPAGLVHFSSNLDKNNPAVALSVYSGQNPDFWFVPNAVFGSRPSISVDVLSKAFQIDTKIVEDIQSKFTK